MKRIFGVLCLVVAFSMALAQKKVTDVDIWVSRNIAPGPKIRVNINTRNVPVVTVTAFHIDPIQWFRFPDLQKKEPKAIGAPVRSWPVTVSSKDNVPAPHQEDRYYSRQVNLPPLPPSVYLLVISGSGVQKWAVVNVTNLAVITKESPKHLLVWVTDAVKGQAIPKAQILVFDSKGKSDAQGTTKPDGTFFTTLSPGARNVVIRSGNDYAGVQAEGTDPDGKLLAHFETDRPIYRAGQKVLFKAILRTTLGNAYKCSANKDVQVEVRDPKNNPIDRLNLKSNANGSVAGSFDLPDEAESGAYTLALKMGNQDAYHTFSVAQYRKPEYKVETVSLEKRYLAGQDIKFKVSAQYYFGAPVQQAEVRYIVRRADSYYFWSDDGESQWFYGGDGNLYPHDSYNQNAVVAEDVAHTDEHGEAVIDIKSDPKAPDSTYSIDVTATDSSRRQVQSSGAVNVYAANIRLSLSSSLIFVPLGRLLPVTVRAVDLDRKPVGAEVTLIMTHQVWDDKKAEYKTVEVARTKVRVPPSGKAIANLPAKVQDDIDIRAEADDGTGRTATAEMSSYVVGPNEKAGHEQVAPTLTTKLNRRSYKPGDAASAYVSTNVRGRPILLVLEGQDIFNYKVVAGSSTWEFPTSTTMSPNAYLRASQWSSTGLLSGGEILPLPDKKRLLSVQLTPDKKEYKPGDSATYKVKTTDQDGKPVSAELTLKVIDDAIYAVSPDNTADLYTTFWGTHEDHVMTFQSAPEELSGGAYQRVSTVAPVRMRFEDTAYWNAFVSTDTNGEGSVSFEMPGNLTTWDASGRAVTAETSVGSAKVSVIATRPVTLRLATPRQMVKGDQLTLIGTINNRTAQSHKFHVRLVPEEMKLDSPTDQDLMVKGNSAATVEWHIHADHMGSQPPALTAEVYATDVPETEKQDYADALRVLVPVNPDGVVVTKIVAGTISSSATATLDLPQDKIEPATKTTVKIWAGVKAKMQDQEQTILKTERYITPIAAEQLELAALSGLSNGDKVVREALAVISRNEQNTGWGYWEHARPNSQVTAEVLSALALAKTTIEVPDNIFNAACAAAQAMYKQDQLWEDRALLASALNMANADKADYLDEVAQHGIKMSPYTELRIARAYLVLNKPDEAAKFIDMVIPDVANGPFNAHVPVGDGIGW
ncbi:MAG TPA: MG2 domain-containing protein, partial [Fimbriimonadaceae bacterium]